MLCLPCHCFTRHNTDWQNRVTVISMGRIVNKQSLAATAVSKELNKHMHEPEMQYVVLFFRPYSWLLQSRNTCSPATCLYHQKINIYMDKWNDRSTGFTHCQQEYQNLTLSNRQLSTIQYKRNVSMLSCGNGAFEFKDFEICLVRWVILIPMCSQCLCLWE